MMGIYPEPALDLGMENLLILARVIAFLAGASFYAYALAVGNSEERRKALQTLSAALGLAIGLIVYASGRTDWLGAFGKSPAGQISILLVFSSMAGHVRILLDKIASFFGAKIDAQKPAPQQTPEKDSDAA